MAVVLNQADLLASSEIALWRDDATRLLAEDGLRDTPVLVVSARTGAGLDDLRELSDASRRSAGRGRRASLRGRRGGSRQLSAAGAATAALRASSHAIASGSWRLSPRPRASRGSSKPSGEAHRHRGALACGWPPVRWVRRLKPDPLRRLRLGSGDSVGRTSLPPRRTCSAHRSPPPCVTSPTRASAGLPAPWPTLVRRAATADDERVVDRLDQAVGSELASTPAPPRWWRVASLLQWLLAAAAVVGAVWIGARRRRRLPPDRGRRAAAGARRRADRDVARARRARRSASSSPSSRGSSTRPARDGASAQPSARSRPGIEAVADELVIAPVERELDAHETLRAERSTVAGGRG